jgi:hypothetical protein
MLATPDDHPFWTVADAPPPGPATTTLRTPGMVLGRDDGQVVALMAQPPGWSFVEQADAKYQKFAYSSRFGFSGDFTMYGLGATDSMLAVTDSATGVRRVREGVVLSEAADGVAFTRWTPLPGVRIDTALGGGAPWHVRVHRLSTDRELSLSETGFALPWEPEGFGPPGPDEPEHGRAVVTSAWGGSTVVELRDDDRPARDAAVSALSPNANIMWPHTIVPALVTTVPAGEHWLVCAVGASHDVAAVAPERAPSLPPALIDRLATFVARKDPA